MLVLSRRSGESIKIGDDITVRILAIRGTHVRLGIAAPAKTTIHREEVFHRIKAALLAEGERGETELFVVPPIVD